MDFAFRRASLNASTELMSGLCAPARTCMTNSRVRDSGPRVGNDLAGLYHTINLNRRADENIKSLPGNLRSARVAAMSVTTISLYPEERSN